MPENNTDAFAARAAEWDANPVRAALGRAFYAEVLAAAPGLAGRSVLEFGCGTGQLGLRLALDHGALLTFVDTSPAMLEVLSAKLAVLPHIQARTLLGEIGALPIAPGSQHLLVTLMALHHVPDVPGALAALRRLIAPGGLLLAGDLMPEDGGFHGPEPAAHNGFAPEALAGMARAAGFAPLNSREFHTVNKPDADGVMRAYPVFRLAARAA